ncbi:MAG: hypothetical protein AAF297_10440 [Planctomycetota bacterium]
MVWARPWLVLVLAASTAFAQRLDLGGPSSPPPDDRPAAHDLIDELQSALDAEMDGVSPPPADANADSENPPPARRDPASVPPGVPLELRRLALVLAERSLGPAAADARDQLWARTLASHFAAFDTETTDQSPRAAAIDLRSLAEAPPRGDALDRALRDALAPLLEAPPPGSAGWLLVSGAHPWAPIDAIEPSAPPSAHAAVAALRAMTPEAVPVELVPAAGVLRLRGATAASLYRPVPRWVGTDLVERHAGALLESLAAASGGSEAANARLDALAAIASAKRALDDLPASRSTRDARVLAVALVLERLAEGPLQSPATLAGALDTVARVARLIEDREGVPDRGLVIRQLRPAWPRLLEQRRRAHQRLADLLPGAIALDRPGTKPALVAVLTDAEDADRRLHHLVHASVVLTPDQFEPVADRVLALLQRTPDRREGPTPLQPDRAEVTLLWFLGDIERLVPAPGGLGPEGTMERDVLLSGGDGSVRRSAWNRLTSGRPVELLDALASRREAWLETWNARVRAHRRPRAEDFELRGGQIARGHARWIAAAHHWFELAEPAVGLAEARGRLRRGEPSFADRWPGWGMDERLADRLLRPYEARLARAAIELASGDAAGAERALREVETRDAVARLAGVLELGLVPDGPRGAEGLPAPSALRTALGELAAGPCDRRWSRFGVARDPIAEACVWAHEGVAASGRTRAEALAAANRAAIRALRRLDAP